VIDRNQIIRRADADSVPAPTVERDYILSHVLAAVAAEKLRCVIQRLQCRDLYDIHELFVVRGLDPSFIWPLFERKARHRQFDPSLFPTRFEERLPQYKARWTNELSDHVAGDPPQFEELLRAVCRALRDSLRRR